MDMQVAHSYCYQAETAFFAQQKLSQKSSAKQIKLSCASLETRDAQYVTYWQNMRKFGIQTNFLTLFMKVHQRLI